MREDLEELSKMMLQLLENLYIKGEISEEEFLRHRKKKIEFLEHSLELV
ncbi:MAG: hypothetical protein H7Y18_09785 [Clostridiaceae bacterium]|nr:hypothetical protein [Clostridiaceae bacterium]